MRRAGLTALAALSLGAPAGAHAAIPPLGCPGQRVAQTFLPWSDPSWYTSVPDGGLEGGGAGWTLDKGAAVVADNEPYYVRGPADSQSLFLQSGASAASPDVCIAVTHPTIRFFARNTGSQNSTLTVSVVFTEPDGERRALTIGVLTATPAWEPTPVLPVTVNLLSLVLKPEIAVQFDADGGGQWSIDDVYLDPYGKG